MPKHLAIIMDGNGRWAELKGKNRIHGHSYGVKAVQEVVAGIKFYDASIGIVIAPNGFTKSANALAEANDIKLIHHSEIKNIN